jgi:hypothetical protein
MRGAVGIQERVGQPDDEADEGAVTRAEQESRAEDDEGDELQVRNR